ncbi:hypothetical protein Tco_1446489 [Tanacetum coccineum]
MEERRQRYTTCRSPILMISKDNRALKRKSGEESIDRVKEITFPPVSSINSSDPVIIKTRISGRQVSRVYMDSGSSWEVIYEHRFLKSKPSIRTAMQRMGIIVSTIYGAIKFCTPRGIGTVFLAHAKERIFVNKEYPEQTIVIGRQLPTSFKMKLQGEPFNTEHRLNEFKHIEPVKKKKRSLAPERNEAMRKKVEDLMKANIL